MAAHIHCGLTLSTVLAFLIHVQASYMATQVIKHALFLAKMQVTDIEVIRSNEQEVVVLQQAIEHLVQEYNTAESRPCTQNYSHYQQCTIKNTAKYMYLMSRNMEVTWYYPEFPECREIKCMHKQWIPCSSLKAHTVIG